MVTTYLQGLMLPIECKAIEPMALALDGGDVQAMQQCIGQGQWQDDMLLRRHWRLVDETLGEADGVYIVAGSDVPKHGAYSVGVARQWCGHLGKVDNCQAGVFAAYASRKGYTLLDRRLYLPEEWFDAAHRERWCKCGIPDETLFKTKPALALEMVQAIVTEGGLRFRWLTCDEAFGRDGAFLDGIGALGRWYVAEVPHDTQVWLTHPATAVPTWTGRGRRPRKARLVPGEPAPQRVDQLAAAVPLDEWHPSLIKEGSNGPLVAEFAFPAAWRCARACRAQACGWSFGVGRERTQHSRSISATRPHTRQSQRWSGWQGCAGRSQPPSRRVKGAWGWITMQSGAG